MEKCLAKALWIGLCLTMFQAETHASSLTGTVQTIRANTGATNAARISIWMEGDTDCPTNGWYAFDGADTGIGRIWTDLVLEAVQSGKQIAITGTGACDAFSVEGISDIDLLSGRMATEGDGGSTGGAGQTGGGG